eukprot:CAMPEP_0175336208 /NCGR_PEP_ID=MMETSP0095-20121207/3691_1 /TAXON_ID=311494 /ORGANISM="Alexandrium monilatum, Strain CCMP3105" /LENGTH=337 /DNA_ID=CAMNT_0016633553 /DNA_START=1 /DNA_END=1014 /DNA_ORIENTATION=+
MAVPAVGFFGLALVALRLGVLRLTGPDQFTWVDQSLRLEWWLVQPALWATSVKQVRDLRSEAEELKRREAEAQAAAQRARRGRRAAMTISAGSLSLVATAVALAAQTPPPETRPPPALPMTDYSLVARLHPQPTALPPPDKAEANGTQRVAALAGGLVIGSLALASSVASRRRPKFHDHVLKELLPQCVRRTVTIQCPGVTRGNVVINVLPRSNGAEVSLTRSSTRGLPAAAWRKTYSFPWQEGTYECRQEALVLENGVLTLVFEADVARGRIIRGLPQPAPALAYSIADGDVPTPPDQEPYDAARDDSLLRTGGFSWCAGAAQAALEARVSQNAAA